MLLRVESYKIPPSADYPLYVTAKRYSTPESEAYARVESKEAQTLIALHSTSFHKETWEPVLDELFTLASGMRTSGGRPPAPIHDVWAIECPNHGESALLNEQVLKREEFAHNFSCKRYAEAVHRFLTAAKDYAPKVDFRTRNLVGIGHSLGANTMLLLQHVQPPFKFSPLIIIEPMVSAEGRSHLSKLGEALISGAKRRRDTFRTKEEVRGWYRSHYRMKKWDPRIIEAFVNHALYWIPERKTYMLCCSREQEIAMYNDFEGSTSPVDDLNRICHVVPTHLILGQIPDYIPRHVHQALVNPASGRQFASVTTMQNVGHLIPQEQPAKVAELISNILSSSSDPSTTPRLTSRL